MAKKTRRELREAFKTGSQPTGADFQQFIESVLNSEDDGIVKQGVNKPLKVTAQGTNKSLLDFYTDKTAPSYSWRIDQKSGLNVTDSNGSSRLFISEGEGNIGISTPAPRAKLHVIQSGQGLDSFRVDDDAADTTPFVITGGGTVGVGTASPDTSTALHAAGNVKLEKGMAVNEFSNDTTFQDNSDSSVPTEKAVKTYVDQAMTTQSNELTEKLSFPQGGIIMWSGTSAPSGWALCDGSQGTPDLRGRFVLGAGQGQNLTNRPIRQIGGEETHTLTQAEMPEHDHAVKIASDGTHKHTFTAWRANFDHLGRATESCNDDDGDGTFNRETHDAGAHKHTLTQEKRGSTTSHNNMPPYYVLAYIMKL